MRIGEEKKKSISDIILENRRDLQKREEKIISSGNDIFDKKEIYDPMREKEIKNPDLDNEVNNVEERDLINRDRKIDTNPGEEIQAAPENIPAFNGIDDASYIDMIPEEPEKPISFSDAEKNIKLIDLFENIKIRGKVLKDQIEAVDRSLIDENDIKVLDLSVERLEKLCSKINSFVMYKVEKESYNTVLYVYMLIRKEFILILKDVFDIVKKQDDAS